MRILLVILGLMTILLSSVVFGNEGLELTQAQGSWTDEILAEETGGYPWADEPNSYAVDPWFFYKRQCTSYAAWKFQAVYGLVFYNTRPGQGSAWNWPALAHDQGYITSSIPQSPAIVSWGVGINMPYGHVAWVEAVHADGTIDVSEYNWGYARNYSTRLGIDPLRYGPPTYIFVPEPSSLFALVSGLIPFAFIRKKK